MDQRPPPTDQPSSTVGHLSFRVNTNYQRNALLGHVLLFGALGTVIAVIGNIIGLIF